MVNETNTAKFTMIPRKFHRRLLKISPKKPVKRRVQNFFNKKITLPPPLKFCQEFEHIFFEQKNILSPSLPKLSRV